MDVNVAAESSQILSDIEESARIVRNEAVLLKNRLKYGGNVKSPMKAFDQGFRSLVEATATHDALSRNHADQIEAVYAWLDQDCPWRGNLMREYVDTGIELFREYYQLLFDVGILSWRRTSG